MMNDDDDDDDDDYDDGPLWIRLGVSYTAASQKHITKQNHFLMTL